MLNSVTETKTAPYLDQEAKNQKKGTLLSATLKVGENKVPLFFIQRSYSEVMANLSFL